MMLCVISYWVLSGAKRRQIQQLRCCVLPTKLLKRRDVYKMLLGSHLTGYKDLHKKVYPNPHDETCRLKFDV